MKILRTAAQMAAASAEARKAGKKITLVPTMGALHAGHRALFREAKKRGDVVVVSIYVNPRQFNDPEDFRKYARDLKGDLKQCEVEGVDLVFAPTDAEVYPAKDASPEVPVPAIAARLEGASRPGHFDGVVAVVSRLFRMVRPQAAVFGFKDYQQMRVIEEMVKEQKLDVSIVRHPTVREKDGLAMSSRNARLSPEGRKKALALVRAVVMAKRFYQLGERGAAAIRTAALAELKKDPAVKVDYVAVVDADTLCEVNPALPVHEAGVRGTPEVPPTLIDRPALVAVAAFVEGVRLIDNGLLA